MSVHEEEGVWVARTLDGAVIAQCRTRENARKSIRLYKQYCEGNFSIADFDRFRKELEA